MSDDQPELEELRRRLLEQESAYAAALDALDALAGFALPQEKRPHIGDHLARLNDLCRPPAEESRPWWRGDAVRRAEIDENRFRGSREEVRERLQPYLPAFRAWRRWPTWAAGAASSWSCCARRAWPGWGRRATRRRWRTAKSAAWTSRTRTSSPSWPRARTGRRAACSRPRWPNTCRRACCWRCCARPSARCARTACWCWRR